MGRFSFIFFLLIFQSGLCINAQVQVNLDGTSKQHTISPMIQGLGIIYSFEADSLYEDGRLAQLYKETGIGFLRWPGGAVTTYYHWNDLNGMGWMDNWKPNYNHDNDKDPENYMDLDEYMALCLASNTEPMLGINMSSGMEWNREDDALNEAVGLLKYCLAHDFELNYIYLDNETYHNGNSFNQDPDGDGESWTAALYGEKINLYADSIRKYLPKVKLIPNWKRNIKSGNGSLKTLINTAGENIDYIDVHWYWRWGEASWEEWIAKSPMEVESEWYDGGTIIEEITAFNGLTASLGHPHIKLASLEWNIGPGPWKEDPNHSKFKTALMQAEMQMQMMLGGLEIGSLWAAHWPGTEDASDRFLLDPDEGHTPNPVVKVFEMYKNALNGDLVSSSSSDNELLVASVVQDDSNAFVYLLNKKETATIVNIGIDGYDIQSVKQAVCFKDPGIFEELSPVRVNDGYSVLVPGNTLSMIEFRTDQSNNTSFRSLNEKSEIKIWPLPASGIINVETKNYKGETSLTVFNLLGESLMQRTFDAGANEPYPLFVKELSAGTYLLYIRDDSGRFSSTKLMIE